MRYVTDTVDGEVNFDGASPSRKKNTYYHASLNEFGALWGWGGVVLVSAC